MLDDPTHVVVIAVTQCPHCQADWQAVAQANPAQTLDGVNLLSLLQRSAQPQSRTLFWRIQQPGLAQKAVRSGRWKYMQKGENELLFDLSRDPGERHNLRYQHPATSLLYARKLWRGKKTSANLLLVKPNKAPAVVTRRELC